MEVTKLIEITINTLINVVIPDILTIIQVALQTAQTTAVTVAPMITVMPTVTSVHLPPTSLTVVAAMYRAMKATHILLVAHAAIIGLHKPISADIVMDLMREMLQDPA